jgi:hypothetical protein
MLGLVFPVTAALATAGAINPSKGDVQAGTGPGPDRLPGACTSSAQHSATTNEERRATLGDEALRALLADAHVTAHGGGDDGPGEFFRANGAYQRDGGRGAIVFQGRFEIRDGAVCVRGEGLPPLCRRVLANGDGTHTFINTADGSSAVMTVTQPR